MKKTVLVTITKEIEVDIPDEMLTEDALLEFSSSMYKVNQIEDLFAHAAQYVVRIDRDYVEGIGKVSYTELFEDVTTEIIA